MKEAVGLLFHRQVDRELDALVAARRCLEERGFEVWEVPREANPRSLRAQLARSRMIVTRWA